MHVYVRFFCKTIKIDNKRILLKFNGIINKRIWCFFSVLINYSTWGNACQPNWLHRHTVKHIDTRTKWFFKSSVSLLENGMKYQNLAEKTLMTYPMARVLASLVRILCTGLCSLLRSLRSRGGTLTPRHDSRLLAATRRSMSFTRRTSSLLLIVPSLFNNKVQVYKQSDV